MGNGPKIKGQATARPVATARVPATVAVPETAIPERVLPTPAEVVRERPTVENITTQFSPAEFASANNRKNAAASFEYAIEDLPAEKQASLKELFKKTMDYYEQAEKATKKRVETDAARDRMLKENENLTKQFLENVAKATGTYQKVLIDATVKEWEKKKAKNPDKVSDLWTYIRNNNSSQTYMSIPGYDAIAKKYNTQSLVSNSGLQTRYRKEYLNANGLAGKRLKELNEALATA